MKLSSLSVGYKGSAPIVKAIEAELSCGEFICLLGRNGSGKSTLLRTLAGLQEPLSGSINNSFTSDSSLPPIQQNRSSSTKHQHPATTALLPLLRTSQISTSLVTPHCPELYHTNVRELVGYGRLPYTDLFGRLTKTDLQAAEDAMQRVGILELADRLIHTLSDGERQKALIARALTQATPILFLDEPSAFLDYPSRRQLMSLLQRLSHEEGKAILLSTHDVELAAAYADRLWILNKHRLEIKNPQDFCPEDL